MSFPTVPCAVSLTPCCATLAAVPPRLAWFTLALLLLLAVPFEANAAVGAGGALPYEAWLTALRTSVTGPVAFAVSIIGIVVAGGVLIFGGELNNFFRSMIFLVLVMALTVGAQNLMGTFFGQGALIGDETKEVTA
ncbi:TrbC/VirB2 family protein [Methylotetracoccus oryzae]|uniref:TrbC/VirB2 family protein n=1 Tax=Methylotetracoccus oryzae TaxID=1919059 RepID=UPI001118C021|nr:TrbC/VirB2 family protein [Methylotetracoccus oryzae]